ncbi:hypothetical protein FPFC_012100 [Fructobacillus pseudoficulneus]|uniref:Uncharacterized protein n=1 Tax=Fructobacillus pseudoficulneus TaxID=220714 RepID=A0A3F3H2A9_9LACO|nr:hypothetical protein FPFC_012100 [Fructobacillus pseudoficulneus]
MTYERTSVGKYTEIDRTPNSVKYTVNVNKGEVVTLPAVMYDHFKYVITLDGKSVSSESVNVVKLFLSSGTHEIELASVGSENGLLLVISLCSIVAVLFYLILIKLTFSKQRMLKSK